MQAISGKGLVNYWLKRQGEHKHLEDVLGNPALDWVKTKNEHCLAKIGEPTGTVLYDKVLSILDSKDKIPHLRKIGSLYYNFWQDATNKRGLWRRTTLESYSSSSPTKPIDWEVVLDIDKLCEDEGESWVYKGHTLHVPVDTTREPTRTLLYLSRGGSDAKVVREFDLVSKQFIAPPCTTGIAKESATGPRGVGFFLPEAKSQVSWVDDDTLLVGTDDWGVGVEEVAGAASSTPVGAGWSLTDSGYPRVSRLWRRATASAAASSTAENAAGNSDRPAALDVLGANSVVLYEGERKDVWLNSYLSHHHGVVVAWRNRGLSFYSSIYSVCLIPPNATGPETATIIADPTRWVVLSALPQDAAQVDQFANQFLITLRSEWMTAVPVNVTAPPPPPLCEGKVQVKHPAGTMLAVDIKDFVENGADATSFTVLFTPPADGRCSMNASISTKNYVVIETLENVRSRLHFWKFVKGAVGATSTWQFCGSEEEAVIRGLHMSAVDDDTSDKYFITVSSFLQPSTLCLADANEGAAGVATSTSSAILKQLPHYFDSSNLEEFQAQATSLDGTVIPYFVIRTKKGDAAASSTVPTLMYGYGGFEIPILPSYLGATGVSWLEKGGCYVSANIRGGGEFGPKWHQAALKENRNKCYEDFIAVAEHLISSGITTSAQLGIRGGSNGGLLMGNMLTMRPDLFGAVVCAVPLLDMWRYSKLLAGASWVAEYGDPETSDWDDFLYKYSSYHRILPHKDAVKDGEESEEAIPSVSEYPYPPLFMSTSTRDDRVHPYHARCFVKRLEELASACNQQDAAKLLYYENIEGGHGGAADNKQQAFMTVLYIEFLYRTIGKGNPRMGQNTL